MLVTECINRLKGKYMIVNDQKFCFCFDGQVQPVNTNSFLAFFKWERKMKEIWHICFCPLQMSAWFPKTSSRHAFGFIYTCMMLHRKPSLKYFWTYVLYLIFIKMKYPNIVNKLKQLQWVWLVIYSIDFLDIGIWQTWRLWYIQYIVIQYVVDSCVPANGVHTRSSRRLSDNIWGFSIALLLRIEVIPATKYLKLAGK